MIIELKDSGTGSDGISNRHNGSDFEGQKATPRDRRSRRDAHTGDGLLKNKQNFGRISVTKELDNYSENTPSTGKYSNRRRRRRSHRRESETQSLPPIGKPGSTTTNSTASTENSKITKRRNRSRDKRSVSLHRGKENYDSRRNRSRRRDSHSKYDENDDIESVENEYYAQLKIGQKEIVSKKRSNVPQKRKPTTFSKRLPAVADYKPDEYKSKRGINTNVKLPPMSQSPSGRTFSTSDPSSLSSNGSYGSRGVRKPRQLEPLDSDIKTFDSNKHRKRTQKLVDQRYR